MCLALFQGSGNSSIATLFTKNWHIQSNRRSCCLSIFMMFISVFIGFRNGGIIS